MLLTLVVFFSPVSLLSGISYVVDISGLFFTCVVVE